MVLCFLADEEAGGVLGSHWVVDNHPALFDGCTEGISELGGFSLTVRDDVRLYLIETAQKGIEWMRLTVEGTAGHGSMINDDNAVYELADAVARLGSYEWPVRVIPAVRAVPGRGRSGVRRGVRSRESGQLVETLGTISKIIVATLRNTANLTMLRAGYKHNVIPGRAEAYVDGRFLPGHRDEFLTTVDEVHRSPGPAGGVGV